MPVIDMIATGHNIHETCINAGLTPKDIQEACGLTTRNAVYKWMNGVCMPTIDNMVIIADLFGVSLDELVVVNHR